MTISNNEVAGADADKQHLRTSSGPRKPIAAKTFWAVLVLGALALGVMGTASQWQSSELVNASEAVVHSSLSLAIAFTFICLVGHRWNGKSQYPSSLLAWCIVLAAAATCIVGFTSHRNSITSFGAAAVLSCFLHTHQSADRSGSLLYFSPPLLALCCVPASLLPVVERAFGTLLSVAIMPILDWLQIPFQQMPAAIRISNGTLELGRFFVAPTTSLLVCCALLIVAWYRRPLASIPFYVASALLWAFGVAVVKITFLVSCMQSRSSEIIDWQFALVSLLGFGTAVMLLFSTDRLNRVVLFQIPDHEKNLAHNPLNRFWNRIFRQMAVSGSVLATLPTEPNGHRRQRA